MRMKCGNRTPFVTATAAAYGHIVQTESFCYFVANHTKYFRLCVCVCGDLVRPPNTTTPPNINNNYHHHHHHLSTT